VIYGAGGAIGGSVARAFAREGATVFPTGREVDALNEHAIDGHLQGVIDEAGRIDIPSMRSASLTQTFWVYR
jgi:NADP-dependent 3-hydroxy acid dehydrogenase YdfG